MAAARPVCEKNPAQEAHLRETRLQAEAYFEARGAAEDNPETSADYGAEQVPFKRHKAAASPLPEVPERTPDTVRLSPPTPRPHPASPHPAQAPLARVSAD